MVNNYVRTRFFAFKQKKLGSSEEARTLLEGAQPFGKEKRITANISNILFKTSNIKPNKQEESQARTSYAI